MTTSHPRLRRTLVATSATTVLAVTGCGDDEPALDEVTVDVTIVGDEVTPVAQSVELGVGETLLLDINSDRAGELHVHSSPEQFADFQPGSSELDLTFDKPGSVDVEEHGSSALIVRVLVR